MHLTVTFLHVFMCEVRDVNSSPSVIYLRTFYCVILNCAGFTAGTQVFAALFVFSNAAHVCIFERACRTA